MNLLNSKFLLFYIFYFITYICSLSFKDNKKFLEDKTHYSSSNKILQFVEFAFIKGLYEKTYLIIFLISLNFFDNQLLICFSAFFSYNINNAYSNYLHEFIKIYVGTKYFHIFIILVYLFTGINLVSKGYFYQKLSSNQIFRYNSTRFYVDKNVFHFIIDTLKIALLTIFIILLSKIEDDIYIVSPIYFTYNFTLSRFIANISVQFLFIIVAVKSGSNLAKFISEKKHIYSCGVVFVLLGSLSLYNHVSNFSC